MCGDYFGLPSYAFWSTLLCEDLEDYVLVACQEIEITRIWQNSWGFTHFRACCVIVIEKLIAHTDVLVFI
jgi:hypothetical protein